MVIRTNRKQNKKDNTKLTPLPVDPCELFFAPVEFLCTRVSCEIRNPRTRGNYCAMHLVSMAYYPLLIFILFVLSLYCFFLWFFCSFWYLSAVTFFTYASDYFICLLVPFRCWCQCGNIFLSLLLSLLWIVLMGLLFIPFLNSVLWFYHFHFWFLCCDWFSWNSFFSVILFRFSLLLLIKYYAIDVADFFDVAGFLYSRFPLIVFFRCFLL